MTKVATTKMSSKGQVVIPEEVRKRLGLETGSRFVVIAENDVIILKALVAPTMDRFEEMIAKARNQARKVGLKKADIQAVIRAARKRS
jgi:AbrB family looped-hinge helix DNA binding protein